MQHARLRRAPTSDSTARWGRPVLPVLLLTAAGGAFVGLAALPAGSDTLLPPAAPAAVAAAQPVPVERPDDLERASRSRPRAALSPSPKPSPVKPSAKPASKPTAKPTPKATRKPTPRPKPKPKATAKPRPAATRAPAPAARTSGGGACPVPAASFTDTYGAARSGGRSHMGTDLLAPYGSPVYAVANGVVDTASSSNGGISLYLRATNGERYFYAHNSSNVARDGQRVTAGQLIARVGSTGNAGDTNHVHFERELAGGSSVNPYRFLRGLCG